MASTAFYATGTGVGRLFANPGSTDFSAVRSAASCLVASAGEGIVQASLDTGAGGVFYITRYLCPIDTSALGASATINSATLKVYTGATGTTGSRAVVVATTQASTTALEVGDYSQFGTTPGSDQIQLNANSNFTFTLDATGLGWISKTGYTKIGIRDNFYDIADQDPAAYDYTTIKFEADNYITLTVDYDPGTTTSTSTTTTTTSTTTTTTSTSATTMSTSTTTTTTSTTTTTTSTTTTTTSTSTTSTTTSTSTSTTSTTTSTSTSSSTSTSTTVTTTSTSTTVTTTSTSTSSSTSSSTTTSTIDDYVLYVEKQTLPLSVDLY